MTEDLTSFHTLEAKEIISRIAAHLQAASLPGVTITTSEYFRNGEIFHDVSLQRSTERPRLAWYAEDSETNVTGGAGLAIYWCDEQGRPQEAGTEQIAGGIDRVENLTGRILDTGFEVVELLSFGEVFSSGVRLQKDVRKDVGIGFSGCDPYSMAFWPWRRVRHVTF